MIHYVPHTSGNWPLRHVTNFRELYQTFYEIMILWCIYSNRVWIDKERSIRSINQLKLIKKGLKCREEWSMKTSFLLFNSVKIFLCVVYTHTWSTTIKYIFIQMFRSAVALWKSWVCKYSVRFQAIKLKLLCETLKNWKMKNSCLISKQNGMIWPTKP